MLGMVLNKRKLLADIKLLGRWGEKRCQRFLERKGLKTLTRNFSCNVGEIDLNSPRKQNCSGPPVIFLQHTISMTGLSVLMLLQ
jgi:hypothetical protein